MTLASNISAIQLRDPAIGRRILAILAETGFNPRRLELEITEIALVDNIKVAQAVTDQLRQAGIQDRMMMRERFLSARFGVAVQPGTAMTAQSDEAASLFAGAAFSQKAQKS